MMWNRIRLASFSVVAAVMMISPVDESWAEECGKVIAKEAVQELTQPFRIGDLTTLYGVACPTFSLALRYRLDNGNQVLFWPVKPSEKQIKGFNAETYKLFKLLIATEVVAGEEDEQTIIWPASLIGKDFNEVLKGN